MRRRDFIKAITAPVAWPLTARAQQQMMPTIGYLGSTSAEARGELCSLPSSGV